MSAAESGGVSNGNNQRPVISGDGSYVAWDSAATNIRPLLDGHTGLDVWRQQVDEAGLVGDPVLVSAGPAGVAGAGWSRDPSITTDGALVAFRSNDQAIASFSTLVRDGVFVWQAGAPLDYVSNGDEVDTGGGDPLLTRSGDWLNNRTCGGSANPPDTIIRDTTLSRQAISDDGRWVVFSGGWCGLGALGSSACFGTCYHAAHFVHDRASGRTIASVDCQVVRLAGHVYGTAGVGSISPPAISADGRVVYSPLGVGVLVHRPDMSEVSGLPIVHGNSFAGLDVSSTGDVISFRSAAALTDGDTNNAVDVFVAGATVERASSTLDVVPNGAVADAALTGPGNRVVFSSAASNVVAGDTNSRIDVFTAAVNPNLLGSVAETAFSDPTVLLGLLPEEAWGCNPIQTYNEWCKGKAGDPVDTASGNYHETYVDLLLPGRGGGLAVSRSYNSAAVDRVGVFGPGWSSNLDVALRHEPGGIVVVEHESGAESRFLSYGGGFIAPERVQATLEPGAGGTLVLTRPTGERLTFDASGRLVSWVDRNGHGLTTTYDAGGDLVTVSDGSGRSIDFTWSGDRLASATDPAGRTVTYGYDAAGDLTSVIDIEDGEWRFGYDAGHRQVSIISPRQVDEGTLGPLVNEYDGAGRIEGQTDAEGPETDYDYTTTPGATRIVDPAGEVRIDHYTDGVRTSRTLAAGTPAESTWHYEYDPVLRAPTRVIDPNGVVDKVMTYDRRGNLATVADALGRTSSFTYRSDRKVATSTDPSGLKVTTPTTPTAT